MEHFKVVVSAENWRSSEPVAPAGVCLGKVQKQGLGFRAGLPWQMHPEPEHIGSEWGCATLNENLQEKAWYRVCVLLTPIGR